MWLCASILSSAKSRSPSDYVNVHIIPLLTPMYVLFIIQPIARQNRNDDNIHPCFTPVFMSNSSVKCWPHITFCLESFIQHLNDGHSIAGNSVISYYTP